MEMNLGVQAGYIRYVVRNSDNSNQTSVCNSDMLKSERDPRNLQHVSMNLHKKFYFQAAAVMSRYWSVTHCFTKQFTYISCLP